MQRLSGFSVVKLLAHVNPSSKQENHQANGIQLLLEIETPNIAPNIAIEMSQRQHKGWCPSVSYFDHGCD